MRSSCLQILTVRQTLRFMWFFLTSVMCDVIEGGYPNIADLQFWPFSQKLHPLVPQTFCLWETANKNKVALKGEEWKRSLFQRGWGATTKPSIRQMRMILNCDSDKATRVQSKIKNINLKMSIICIITYKNIMNCFMFLILLKTINPYHSTNVPHKEKSSRIILH